MSFIKIKDPRRREELIKDLIETRKRIKDNFIARKVGEAEYQIGLTKLFKPVTETQKATAKEITEAQKAATEKITQGLLPIKEALENPIVIPPIEDGEEKKAITLKESLTEEEKTNLGPITETFLKTPWNKENLDLDFGLNTQNEERKFKFGDKEVKFVGDNIFVGGEEFIGTPGFWALIISKNPSPDDYETADKIQYEKLLIKTNAIFQGNNPENTRPKGNYRGDKWKEIIKPIWEEIKPKPIKKGGKGGKGKGKRQEDPQPSTSETNKKGKRQEDPQPSTSETNKKGGKGLTILPSNPNALIDRFDLLFSSQKAGHTGVRNEIISILDELKRQGVINVQDYKKLNHLIKK